MSLFFDNYKRLIAAAPWPQGALRLPRLQAHRGFCLEGAQENTLAAFKAAREKNILMFECDVRLSKDKIPVLFHDENLKRIGGEDSLVKDLTAEEMAKKTNAPKLIDVLRNREIPQLINLELKSRIVMDDPLERKVSEVVKQARAENRVLFSSFNPFSLWRISQYLPDVPRALLVSSDEHPDNHIFLRKMLLAPMIDIHLLHLEQKMVTDREIQFWKYKKMPVAVWTVNEKESIEKFLKLGAVSVITDTPTVLGQY